MSVVGRRCGGGFEIESVLEAQKEERRRISERKRRAEIAEHELKLIQEEQDKQEQRQREMLRLEEQDRYNESNRRHRRLSIESSTRSGGMPWKRPNHRSPSNANHHQTDGEHGLVSPARGADHFENTVHTTTDSERHPTFTDDVVHRKHSSAFGNFVGPTGPKFRGVEHVVLRKISAARKKSLAEAAAEDAMEQTRKRFGFPDTWRPQTDAVVEELRDNLRDTVIDRGQQVMNESALVQLEELGIEPSTIGCELETVRERERLVTISQQMGDETLLERTISEGAASSSTTTNQSFRPKDSIMKGSSLAHFGQSTMSETSMKRSATSASSTVPLTGKIKAKFKKEKSEKSSDGLLNLKHTARQFESITEPPIAINFVQISQSVLSFASLPGDKNTNANLFDVMRSPDGVQFTSTLFWFTFGAFFHREDILEIAGQPLQELGELLTRIQWEARGTGRAMDSFADVVSYVICLTYVITFTGLPADMLQGSDNSVNPVTQGSPSNTPAPSPTRSRSKSPSSRRQSAVLNGSLTRKKSSMRLTRDGSSAALKEQLRNLQHSTGDKDVAPWSLDFMDRVAMLVLLAVRGSLPTTAFLEYIRLHYFNAKEIALFDDALDSSNQPSGQVGFNPNSSFQKLRSRSATDVTSPTAIKAPTRDENESNVADEPHSEGHQQEHLEEGEQHEHHGSEDPTLVGTSPNAQRSLMTVPPTEIIPFLLSQQDTDQFNIFNNDILDFDVAAEAVKEQIAKEKEMQRNEAAQRLRATSANEIYHYRSTMPEEVNYRAQLFLQQQRPSSRVLLKRGLRMEDFSAPKPREEIERKQDENEFGVIRCAPEAEILAKTVCQPQLQIAAMGAQNASELVAHNGDDTSTNDGSFMGGTSFLNFSSRSMGSVNGGNNSSVFAPGTGFGSHKSFAGAMRAMSRSHKQTVAASSASMAIRSDNRSSTTVNLLKSAGSSSMLRSAGDHQPSTRPNTRGAPGTAPTALVANPGEFDVPTEANTNNNNPAELGEYLLENGRSSSPSMMVAEANQSTATVVGAQERTVQMLRGDPSVYDAVSLADPLGEERYDFLVGRRIPVSTTYLRKAEARKRRELMRSSAMDSFDAQKSATPLPSVIKQTRQEEIDFSTNNGGNVRPRRSQSEGRASALSVSSERPEQEELDDTRRTGSMSPPNARRVTLNPEDAPPLALPPSRPNTSGTMESEPSNPFKAALLSTSNPSFSEVGSPGVDRLASAVFASHLKVGSGILMRPDSSSSALPVPTHRHHEEDLNSEGDVTPIVPALDGPPPLHGPTSLPEADPEAEAAIHALIDGVRPSTQETMRHHFNKSQPVSTTHNMTTVGKKKEPKAEPSPTKMEHIKRAALSGGIDANKNLTTAQLQRKVQKVMEASGGGVGESDTTSNSRQDGNPLDATVSSRAFVPGSSAIKSDASVHSRSGRKESTVRFNRQSSFGSKPAKLLSRNDSMASLSSPNDLNTPDSADVTNHHHQQPDRRASSSMAAFGRSTVSRCGSPSSKKRGAQLDTTALTSPSKIISNSEMRAVPFGVVQRTLNMRAQTPLSSSCTQNPPHHVRAQNLSLTDQVPVLRQRFVEARRINQSVQERAKQAADERRAQRQRDVRAQRTIEFSHKQSIAELNAITEDPLRRSEYVDEVLRREPARRNPDPLEHREYLSGTFMAQEAKRTSDAMKRCLRKLDGVFAARKKRRH